MEPTFPYIIATAIVVAGQKVRRLKEAEDLDALIRDEMGVQGIPEVHFDEIYTLVNVLMNFSDSVRVAERKNFPIVTYLGETIPPK